MVEETEIIWEQMGNNTKSIGDHCIRITKLEQEHLWETRTKQNNINYILGAVIVLEFIFIVIERFF